MVSVPARCGSCGFEFQPRAIEMSGGASVTIENCTTSCPRCGGTARFAEGTLRADDDKFRILSAPSVTREMLQRLDLLVEEVYRDPRRLERIGLEAEAIHRGFGSLFAPANWSPDVKAAVVAAMTALIVAKCSPSPTVNVSPRLIIEMPEPGKPDPPMGRYGNTPLPIRFSK